MNTKQHLLLFISRRKFNINVMESNNIEDSDSDYRDANEDETNEHVNHGSRGEGKGVDENGKTI